MLNIHLNGEVTLTPDFKAIQQRIAERREKERRCKYGLEEIKCNVYLGHCNSQDEVKPISRFGRCPFSFSDCCPCRRKRKETGLMKKNFDIDNRTFRKMQSAAHYLVKKFAFSTIFFTLTFPQFIKYLTPNEANRLFSKFVENLRRRHGINAYIAVRENGTKFGRLHFHCAVNMPFISFSYLNDYWCNIISDYCKYAPNALQTDPKNKVIKNPVRAMYYLAKYFSKSHGQKSESRIVFISNNLLKSTYDDYINKETGEVFTKTVSNIKRSFNYSQEPAKNLFKRYPSFVVTYESEYTTGLKIANSKDFKAFCNEFLYNVFDLPADNKPMLMG